MWGIYYMYGCKKQANTWTVILMITVMEKMCLDSGMQWVWVWALITTPLDRSTLWLDKNTCSERADAARSAFFMARSVLRAMIQHRLAPISKDRGTLPGLYAALLDWACYLSYYHLMLSTTQCLVSAFISLFSSHLLFPLLYISVFLVSISVTF